MSATRLSGSTIALSEVPRMTLSLVSTRMLGLWVMNLLVRGAARQRAGFHTDEGSYNINTQYITPSAILTYLVTADFFERVTVNDVVVSGVNIPAELEGGLILHPV